MRRTGASRRRAVSNQAWCAGTQYCDEFRCCRLAPTSALHALLSDTSSSGRQPCVVHPRIGAAGSNQLVVGTVLDEPAVVEHEHPVGAGGGRQTVGDRDRGAPCGQLVEGRPMRTSVSASTDEVASSSTSTSGSTSEPAPARRADAHPPTAARRAGRPRCRARRAASPASRSRSRSTMACSRSARLSVGPGEAEVGGDRAVEQERLLRHDHQPLAQLGVGDCVSGTPPTRTVPIVGSAKRATGGRASSCPNPVSPTTATCWPAGMWALTSISTGVVVLVARRGCGSRT